MSELLANTLPIVAQEEGIDWEEDCYEQGQLCPSEKERIKTSTNKLTQKPEKLSIRMESMRHDIEFRQSNRSADFIQGIEEEDSDDRFINRGRMLHTLFSVIETAEDIDPAIERLILKELSEMMRKKKWLVKLQRKLFLLLKFKIGIPENGHSLMNVLLSIKKKEFCKPVVRIV